MGSYIERAELDWTEDSIRLFATPSSIAKSTFFYIQEVGYFKTGSNYYTERENLNSFLIVFTLSGMGYLKYSGKTYTLLPNLVFFIDCMEYQFYKTDENDLWEMVWVHFNGGTSRGYYEQFCKHGSPVIHMGQDTSLPQKIQKLIHVHQNKDIRTEAISSKLIVDLLTEILLAVNEIDSKDLLLPDLIQNIMKEIDKRFNEKISLHQLAHTYAISKFHLIREFKKYTGMTPNEYIINCRITYAKNLLKYSNHPVSEIANKIGIENVSHFINLFKAREEVTPLAFRKCWQGGGR